MAGGTYTVQNKVRPGAYFNFASNATQGSLGERGVTTMALKLSWGAAKQVLTIHAGDNVKTLLGYDLTDAKLLLIREALKRAGTLLLYRLNAGTKAAATVGSLTATAKYGGVRGNDLKILVQTNVDDPAKFDVKTLLGADEVDNQVVADIAGLVPNAWLDWSGTGTLTASAGAALTNGADGTVLNADHSDYLSAIEVFDFETVALPSSDPLLKSLYAAFTKRLRDDEGKKIQAVLENYPSANYEGVISVKNGVVLSSGTVLDAVSATAWVAAATAAAGVNETLTYQAYEDAVDANPRYTNSQIEAALKAGEFVFTQNQGRALVEQDINSLTSFTTAKGRPFAKNRVIRVLDAINNDLKATFESFYVGKIDNNPDGRNLLRNEYVKYLESLQSIGAIQHFSSQTDISITQGDLPDSVYSEVAVQPVDAVEKIYTKVKVN
ncbi:phage tail sheath subtilisin-like domain-containing protein [Paenibacillus alba]|uniref:phage tail sheath family protein n=1 Tax=Paenibacillus alba TaxID=1197127 RepID=UPI001563F4E0|nr:phage tail sheath family protein [Paenibacillus alba]NQX68064.1 phage tail sheath subtilisin-like domain-containing protein [Paenibacillus alba]